MPIGSLITTSSALWMCAASSRCSLGVKSPSLATSCVERPCDVDVTVCVEASGEFMVLCREHGQLRCGHFVAPIIVRRHGLVRGGLHSGRRRTRWSESRVPGNRDFNLSPAPKTALERVPGAVSEQCAHACGRHWLRNVKSVFVAWIAVDALTLRLSP